MDTCYCTCNDGTISADGHINDVLLGIDCDASCRLPCAINGASRQALSAELLRISHAATISVGYACNYSSSWGFR